MDLATCVAALIMGGIGLELGQRSSILFCADTEDSSMLKYQVNVKAPGEDRTAFVKALRTVAGISLKRAADLSVHFDRFRNSTLVAGLGKAAAEHIAETLVASGATAAVMQSPLDTPMMCCPEAEHSFKWGRLRTLVRIRRHAGE